MVIMTEHDGNDIDKQRSNISRLNPIAKRSQRMRICISVIIPVYNRPDLLVRALRSVSEQTRRDFEIIVVDDGSNIDIGPVLAEINDPRLRYLRHQEPSRCQRRAKYRNWRGPRRLPCFP